MKLSFVIFVCCLTFLKFSSANFVTIKCSYYLDYDNLYSCLVENKEVFTDDRVRIKKIEGQHLDEKSNNDVEVFGIQDAPNLKFFPRKINNVFKNLTKIFIQDSNLTEITSEDLKVFPELKALDLSGNEIEVIREDTFKFNPELEEIWLDRNKIRHIDFKAFNNLENLKKLWLHGNICETGDAENREEVLEMVKIIEENSCQPGKFTTMYPFEIFNEELENFTSPVALTSFSDKIKINFLFVIISFIINSL
ncbi:hypothetical protein PVAND_008703 [Polypedilum vanderplanki]|uniref:Uncharacterized protein n=1 Tax=Polypedilum vanderplanki TaxID=319348 RepID=A0A9J6CAT2_POLVA|nr:hypothetical protein PVAND_008703 [Polypedilum vanderplanki]